MAHRRKFGGGRGEAVRKRWALKAIICRMWWMPPQAGARCLCAGFSRLPRADAGANPVVAALLDDGLARGYADAESAAGCRSGCS